jgi:carboxymethylenebutenolidase
VIEEAVEIRTPDGVADGFLFHAEGERNPGVIHLTDIGGIRPAQHDMARKLSDAGFTVLMPNLFYRTGKPPLVQFPIRQSEEVNKRLAELRDPLTPEAVARDASAYADYLAANAATVEGPMGVVGYCFAGAIAMRIAAARPDRIRAAASFHAGRLFTEFRKPALIATQD